VNREAIKKKPSDPSLQPKIINAKQVQSQGETHSRPTIHTDDEQSLRKKSRIQFPLSTRSRYGNSQKPGHSMADFEKANKRPKISNKNVLLKQINDGQDGDSTEKQSNTQTEEQNKLRIVSKAAVTHVEKFQNNTA